MRLSHCCIIFLCLITFLVSNKSTAGISPKSVVHPGEGVGDIRLNESMEEVVNVLKHMGWGQPGKFVKSGDGSEYFLIYSARGTTFVFRSSDGGTGLGESALYRIVITSPSFVVIPGGISIGDDYEMLQGRKYKPRYLFDCGVDNDPEEDSDTQQRNIRPEHVHYKCAGGITFVVNGLTSVIEAIEIFSPEDDVPQRLGTAPISYLLLPASRYEY